MSATSGGKVVPWVRRAVGLLCLLGVILLWVGSSELTKVPTG